jgi:hypothetical protein
MVFRILLRQIDLGSFLMHGCRKEYYPRNNFLGCYVLDNGYSCSQQRRPDCSITFPGILVLVVLPIVIDYFNGCTRARSLGIASQIKIMGELLLIFSGQWFDFIWLPYEKYKIMS